MSGVLPDRLEPLLAELDELWRPSRTKWTLTEVPGATGLKLSHPAMTREWATNAQAHRGVTLADIEDLEAAGLVAVDWGYSRNGRRGELRLTAAGEAQVDRFASPPSPPAVPVGSDWQQNVMPLLLAAASIEQQLAPGAGITQDALNAALGRPPGDPQTATTLVQLSAADYFRDEQSVEQIDGPISFRLGERALQRVAGWPGAGGNLASELLALIDQRLEDPTVSEDETHPARAPPRHRRRRGQGRGHRPVDRAHQEPHRRLTALIKSHTGV